MRTRPFYQSHAPRIVNTRHSRVLPVGWTFVTDDNGVFLTDEAGTRLIAPLG